MVELKDPTHRFNGTLSPRTEKAAEIISFIGQPIFLPIPVMLLLSTLASSIGEYLLVAGVALFFVSVLPTVIVFYFSHRLNRTDGDIPEIKDRIVPMAIGTVCYTLGVIALYLISAPKIMTVLMLAYAVVTFVMMLITFRWKISIHAVGVIGPSMALGYAFWPWGLLFLLLLIPIVWSRYVLKKHTPLQLFMGALTGFVITYILFYFLLPLY